MIFPNQNRAMLQVATNSSGRLLCPKLQIRQLEHIAIFDDYSSFPATIPHFQRAQKW